MRNAFAQEITRLGAEDPRVVLLSGDIGNKLFDGFKAACPGRFINCGVAEANMMGVAAGMALSGLRPVVYTIAPFTVTRCFEQIRIDVCYHAVPVMIVGTGAGLAYAELGPTHHSCEDIALLRSLPRMTVFCPGDPQEMRLGLHAALNQAGPTYVRLGKKGEAAVHAPGASLTLGQAIPVRDGAHLCLISTGTLLPNVVAASDLLAQRGISAAVDSFHSVKPLDEARLAQLFARYDLVVTVEEHSRIGGLGGAVAEWLARQRKPQGRLLALAADDVFLHKVFTQESARRHFGLDAAGIAAAVADDWAA